MKERNFKALTREQIVARVERLIWHYEHSGGSRPDLAERIVRFVRDRRDKPLPEDPAE